MNAPKPDEKGMPRVLLVTGASRGIGRCIAVRGAAEGYSIAINFFKDEDAARETLRQCEDAGTDNGQCFQILRADIGQSRERSALFSSVIERFGRLDFLVNNAGTAPRRRVDITETTEESFDEVLGLNLRAPFFLSQMAAKYWLENERETAMNAGRSIITISSVSAEMASLNRAEYCISKAGLSMAMKAWTLRLAPHDIGVYELRPGIIRTDMTEKVKDMYNRRIAGGLVPQGRWGEGADVAKVCAAIWRGDLAFSPGAVIHIDGALHVSVL